MIGASLDPAQYQDPHFVAERLHRMTAGRRRIELPDDQVDVVATTLQEFQVSVADATADVLAMVREEVPIPRRPA
jgi:hypothetical protein